MDKKRRKRYGRSGFLMVLLTAALSAGCGHASDTDRTEAVSVILETGQEAAAHDLLQGTDAEGTEATEAGTAEEEGTAEEAEKMAVITGSVSGGEALTEAQREPLTAFMDAFYRSMAELEPEDCGSLFTEDEVHAEFRARVPGTSWTAVTRNRDQAGLHEAVWEMMAGIRRASGLNPGILSCNYTLDCQEIRELEDGCVQIEAMEYADMRFAHTADTVSSVTGLWHSFVIKDMDGRWLLTHHAAYDSAYFPFIRWENSGTGGSAGGISGEEVRHLAREQILRAEEAIRSRREASFSTEAPGGSPYPSADHAYDREAAAAYAREWAGDRNPRWHAYDGAGGNCMNYVSQCLYAAGIPMDPSGGWYWYSDADRAPAWTGVSAFRRYALENSGYGLCAAEASYDSGETGDVILMYSDERYNHAVIITEPVYDSEGEIIDYLICSNTGNYRDFPAAAYTCQKQELVKILGWNE